MTGIATRRHRITLMREEDSIGGGGRMVKTTPIIATAWADIEESAGGVEERADKQVFPFNARFTVRYNTVYQVARVIGWRGAQYRISGTERSLVGDQSLVFQARLMDQ